MSLTPDEGLNIVKLARQFDRWIGDPDDLRLTAMAWLSALDIRLTVDVAAAIVRELASTNTKIGPGSINEAFLRTIRPPHQYGSGRPHLAGGRLESHRRAPMEIGAEVPVKPQDVPGYHSREKRQQSAATAVACPYCRAQPNDPCTRPVPGETSGVRTRYPHPSRYEAAGMKDPVALRLGEAVPSV